MFGKSEFKSVLNETQTQQFMLDFMADFGKLRSNQNNTGQAKDIPDLPSKPNKYRAIESSDVDRLERSAKQLTMNTPLHSSELKLWHALKSANALAQKIHSCDLPSDRESDAALVKITHKFADELLQRGDKSWLRKILEIALYAKNSSFGNCQEKAFFGFACLLLANLKSDIKLTSLRLAFFDNHFIVVVNERFLMDPWLNIAFPLDPQNPDKNLHIVFDGFGELINYFSINTLKNHCIVHQVVEDMLTRRDFTSEKDLPICMNFLMQQEVDFNLPDPNPKKSKRNDKENEGWEDLGDEDVVDNFLSNPQRTELYQNKRQKGDESSDENQPPLFKNAPASHLFFTNKVLGADSQNINTPQLGSMNFQY
jgi:hypothetical protein